VAVAVPQDDVVSRHLALLAIWLYLRLGHERTNARPFIDNGFICVHLHLAPVRPDAAVV
jgi:hypothetical protein